MEITLSTSPTPAVMAQAIFDDLGENTKRTYLAAWQDFRDFMQAPSVVEAVGLLIAAGQGGANFVVSRYRKHLLDSGIAATTAKTRLGALCGIIKRARRIGLCNWALDIEAIHTRKMSGVEDNPVRGYSSGQFNDLAMIFEKIDATTPAGARDKAIIELLYNPSLRRAECARLDLEHVDWINDRLSILGKGRHQNEWVPMPGAAKKALAEWLKFRGNDAGPLFTRLDKEAAGQLLRISDTAIYKIVRDRAAACGIVAWPHALRHTGITDVAAVTNGNLVATAGHARHRSTDTTMIYVNNVQQQAREAGRAVDALRA